MNIEVLSRNTESPIRPTSVLLVHGAWHEAWCWKGNFLDAFADAGYPTYALSLRGHGNSYGICDL